MKVAAAVTDGTISFRFSHKCMCAMRHTNYFGRHGDLQSGLELVEWYVVDVPVPPITLIGKEDDGRQASGEELSRSDGWRW